jgi:UDP-galactopyranose mutase
MPSSEHQSHRFICTGNFAASNNVKGKTTASLEFTDYISKEDIEEQIKKIPFSPKYITHKFTKYTYPIQSSTTRGMITSLKSATEKEEIYLLGRFAEWEYYNMDAAIGAGLDLAKRL